MTRVRVLLFFLGILVVGFLGYLAVTYAKGYRLDFKTLKFVSKGILVVKTDPTGAQVFVDDLIGASDSNSLSPGT